MYTLEERIYFDGAGAGVVVLAENSNNTSTNAESKDASSGADNSSSSTNTSNSNSSSDSGTAQDTSSAPAKDTSSTPVTDSSSTTADSSSTDSSAVSGKVDIDALIASILNTDTVSSDTTHTTLVVSSAVENASEIARDAQEHNITIVTYNPAEETLQQLFKDIQTALNGEKASSINFVTTDNNAAGFSLISASTISSENISIKSDVSAFVKETASLLAEGGRITFSGDASLTDSSFSALETAFADASGVKVSFIDASTGNVTTAAPDAMDYNIIFVDLSVPGYADLLKNLAPDTEVYFLDKDSDGVSLISHYLEGKHNVDSIQIIAHGNDGEILLGKTLLRNDNISYYSSDIQNWGKALTSDGDILIYSCDTAETDIGKDFTDEIASLTGADLAVSTDGTGGPGSNWTLEYTTGTIEAATTLDGSNYRYHLAEYTVKNSNDSGVDSLRWAVTSATADGDLVSFLFDGTHSSYAITLSSADINISHGITINGSDSSLVSIASSNKRHITISSSGSGTVTIENVTFSGMSSTNGGAILVNAGTSISIDHVTFTKCIASTNGGAVYIDGGTASISNSTFGQINDTTYTYANKADNGGAIYLKSGTLTVNNSDFYYNSVTAKGGAIFVNTGTTLTFTGSSENTFTGNKVTGGIGGAIYLINGTMSESAFSGSYTFTKNTASADGGAVYITGSSASVMLTNATFGVAGDTSYASANSARNGGAIYVDSGTLTLSDPDFYYNSTTVKGGAILVNTGATLRFAGSSEILFTGNKVTGGDGGAIYVNNGTFSESEFSGSYTFTKNTASSDGGAIYITGSSASATLTNATFGVTGDTSYASSNSAKNGGAIYAASGTLTLSNPDFYYNSATTGHGGAIYAADSSNTTLTGSSEIIFTGNKATAGHGGAIYITGTLSASVTLTNATFGVSGDTSYASANRAVSGGAVYVDNGKLYLTNSSFYYNSATTSGGAIYIASGKTLNISGASAANALIFTGNKAVVSGGAIYNDGTINAGVSGDSYAVSLTFMSNLISGATGNGGAVYNSGTFTMANAHVDSAMTFTKNTANSANGGAIYTTGSGTSVTLSNATFGVDGDTSYASANSAIYGGAIYINNGILNLTNSNFYYNSATTSGGAVYIIAGKTLNISGAALENALVFTGNKAAVSGGAIYNDGTINAGASGDSYAVSLTFTSNLISGVTGNGGAVYNSGTFTMVNANIDSSMTFTKNTASSANGGAIYITGLGASVTLSNATFGVNGDTSYTSANSAVSGGAIYINNGILNLTNSNFYYNSATTSGGAVYIIAGKTLNISGAALENALVFTGNKAVVSGGAIYNAGTITAGDSGDSYAVSLTFTSNLISGATGNGGAIYSSGTFTMVNANIDSSMTFTKNTAISANGGAIYAASGTITLKGATFGTSGDTLYAYENKALSGGAIYIAAGTLNLTSCNFYYNEATATLANTGGGAIFIYGNNGTYGTVNAQSSTFTGNKALGSGGAIFNLGTLTLGSSSDAGSGCTFTLNIAATGSGGAIFNNHQGTSPAQITAYYSNFGLVNAGNTADDFGGALYSYYGVVTFSNCTLSYNNTTTSDGGAIYFYTGTLGISNCTLSHNDSTGLGGAVYIGYDSGSTAKATLTLSGTNSFDSNTSASYGSSIYAAGGSEIKITATGVTTRETSGTASSIYLASAGAVLSTLTISADTAFSNIIITDNGTISIGTNKTMTMNSGAGFANGTGTISAASGTLLFATNSAASSYVPGGTIANISILSSGTKTMLGNLSPTALTLGDSTTLALNGKVLTLTSSPTVTATSAIIGNTTNSEIIVNSNGTITLPTISTDSASALYKLTMTKGTVALASGSNNYISNIAMNGSNAGTATTISIGSSSLHLIRSPVVSNYNFSTITGTSSSSLYLEGGTVGTPVSITIPVFSGSLNTLSINDYTSLIIKSAITIAGSGNLTLGTSSNLFLNGYVLTLTGSTVTATTATGISAATSKIYGGANDSTLGAGVIAVNGGSADVRTSLSNITFTKASNSAVNINSNAYANIANCSFTDNSITGNGGAVYVSSLANLTLADSTFTNNTATVNGGAIYNTGTLNLAGGTITFTGNGAASGGEIYNNGSMTASGGVIIQDTSVTAGDIVIATGKTLTLTGNATFTHFAIANNGTFTIGANTLTLSSSSVTGTLTGGINSSLAINGSVITTLPTITGGLKNLTIDPGAGNTINMSEDLTIARTLTGSSGSFSIGAHTLSIGGDVTGTIIGGTTSSIAFIGTGNTTLPSITNGLGTLIMNGVGGTMALGANLTLANSLTLNAGYLDIGNYNLSMSAAATLDGTPSSSTMVITGGTGNLIKYFNAANASFLFPVGTLAGSTYEYTPIAITFTSAAYGANAYVEVKVINAKESHVTDSSYINRYWPVVSNDISAFSATINAQYLTNDIIGVESALYGRVYTSPGWNTLNNTNTATHSFTGTVSQFGNITAFGHIHTPPDTKTPETNIDTQQQEPEDNKYNDKQISDIYLQVLSLMPKAITHSEMTLDKTTWNDISSRITDSSNGLSNGERGVMTAAPIESATENPVIIDEHENFILSATGTDDDDGLPGNYDYTPMSCWSSKFDKHPLFKSNVDKLLDALVIL